LTWFCSPSERDLKHLRADYAGAQTLKNCLPPHAHLEGSAAIVVAAKIHDLPVIADVLLPLAGFKRPTRVLLARRPASPDVTDAEVLIAAERGDIGSSAPEGWLDDVNPIEIAEMLYRDASWTLHLFATAKAKKAREGIALRHQQRRQLVRTGGYPMMSELVSLLCSAVQAKSRDDAVARPGQHIGRPRAPKDRQVIRAYTYRFGSHRRLAVG